MTSGRLRLQSNHGTILILVLWALTLLTVLAVNLGVAVRQRISLVARVERRAEARSLATQGVRLALAVLHSDDKNGIPAEGSAGQKMTRYNNPEVFCAVPLGAGLKVTYRMFDEKEKAMKSFCGLVDEERKINVNKADRPILTELMKQVFTISPEDAGKMANAIIDWRELGESEIKGFVSEEYYDNLEFPYPQRKEDFQLLEELLLLRGMSPERFSVLRDFVTVYGSGQVNVNTAPAEVLLALGMDTGLVRAILTLRRGPDGKEMTQDDVWIPGIGELLHMAGQFVSVNEDEVAFVQGLSSRGLLGVRSRFFRVYSRGTLANGSESAEVESLLDLGNDSIVSWRERMGESAAF